MNYQIQGLPSMRRCTGLRSRLSYFSITGVELHLAQGYLGQQSCVYPRLVCSGIRTDL
jgi:hypothetical protein